MDRIDNQNSIETRAPQSIGEGGATTDSGAQTMTGALSQRLGGAAMRRLIQRRAAARHERNAEADQASAPGAPDAPGEEAAHAPVEVPALDESAAGHGSVEADGAEAADDAAQEGGRKQGAGAHAEAAAEHGDEGDGESAMVPLHVEGDDEDEEGDEAHADHDGDHDHAHEAPATARAASTQPVQARAASTSLPSRWAREDRYNRGAVKSNKFSSASRHLRRPGVRVAGRDIFRVKKGTKRYLITDGPNHTAEFDTIPNRDISGNPLRPGHKPQVAINPARSRILKIGGARKRCVLVWVRGGGPAWVDIARIEGNTSAIRAAVDAHADKWAPKAPSASGATPKKFKAGNLATHPMADRFITPRMPRDSVENRVRHYLFRDRSGGYYNINMNLPQPDAPPVAIDSAREGDAFFVAKGGSFSRLVATFGGKGAHDNPTKRSQWMTWVFGFMGKKDSNGDWVPDRTRRGWVPAAVLG